MPNHNGQEKIRINYIYAPMVLKWPSLEDAYKSINIEFHRNSKYYKKFPLFVLQGEEKKQLEISGINSTLIYM